MPKLPVVSGREAICAFEKLGYYKVRQEGSHVRMKCDEKGRAPITLVADKKDVKLGYLNEPYPTLDIPCRSL